MPTWDEPMVGPQTRVLPLRSTLPRSDRPEALADDLCFTPQLVAAFVDAYTHPGDLVVDPFAGFGTTVTTALRRGRRAIGVEIDPERIVYSRAGLDNPSLMWHEDARIVDWRRLPRFALSITSPPYMSREGHDRNPLNRGRTDDDGYDSYLSDLQQIYRGLSARAVGPQTRIVVNVANLRSTRLAWDVGAALSDVLTFERELVLNWDEPQDWFTQDYCLVYRPRVP